MDQTLLAAFAIFPVGFIAGYMVRDSISRHRRAKAKRSRIFFDAAPRHENLVEVRLVRLACLCSGSRYDF